MKQPRHLGRPAAPLLGVLFLTCISTGCHQEKLGFQVKDGQSVFVAKVTGGPGSPIITRQIAAADPATFKPVNAYSRGTIPYAKDATKVLLGHGNSPFLLEDCDALSFKILTPVGRYAQDKQHVYYWGLKLEGSDSKTFELLDPPYSRDAKQVYAGARVIPGADPAGFEVVVPGDTEVAIISSGRTYKSRDDTTSPTSIWGWARDGRYYYRGSVRVNGADYDTFEILGTFYAKDANHVYYYTSKNKYGTGEKVVRVVSGADAQTFVLITPIRGRDKSGEFVRGKRKE